MAVHWTDKVVEEGVVNDAEDGATFVDETEGDADEGKAVDEVGCAIWSMPLAPILVQRNQRTDGVDTERSLISQRWTRSRGIRFLSDTTRHEF
jgi:hypothetical protein